jgi:hypothetical protein
VVTSLAKEVKVAREGKGGKAPTSKKAPNLDLAKPVYNSQSVVSTVS